MENINYIYCFVLTANIFFVIITWNTCEMKHGFVNTVKKLGEPTASYTKSSPRYVTCLQSSKAPVQRDLSYTSCKTSSTALLKNFNNTVTVGY